MSWKTINKRSTQRQRRKRAVRGRGANCLGGQLCCGDARGGIVTRLTDRACSSRTARKQEPSSRRRHTSKPAAAIYKLKKVVTKVRSLVRIKRLCSVSSTSCKRVDFISRTTRLLYYLSRCNNNRFFFSSHEGHTRCK